MKDPLKASPRLDFVSRGILFLSMALSVFACSMEKEMPSDPSGLPWSTYTCSDGTIIEAREQQGPGIELQMEGYSGVLEPVRSASGSRYSDGTTEWWEKGGIGFLRKNGQIIKRKCST